MATGMHIYRPEDNVTIGHFLFTVISLTLSDNFVRYSTQNKLFIVLYCYQNIDKLFSTVKHLTICRTLSISIVFNL